MADRSALPDLSDAERARLTAALSISRDGKKLVAVLLADRAGRVLVELSDSPSAASETSEALHALAQRIVAYHAALCEKADPETHFFDWDGRQVIGKWVEAGGRSWLLVALCPPKAPYKQAVARMIKALETALSADQPTVKTKHVPRKPKLP